MIYASQRGADTTWRRSELCDAVGGVRGCASRAVSEASCCVRMRVICLRSSAISRIV